VDQTLFSANQGLPAALRAFDPTNAPGEALGWPDHWNGPWTRKDWPWPICGTVQYDLDYTSHVLRSRAVPKIRSCKTGHLAFGVLASLYAISNLATDTHLPQWTNGSQ